MYFDLEEKGLINDTVENLNRKTVEQLHKESEDYGIRYIITNGMIVRTEKCPTAGKQCRTN